MKMTLNEFLIEYVESITQIEVRKDFKSFPRFFNFQYLDNPRIYEEISSKEISMVRVEDGVLVIYVD